MNVKKSEDVTEYDGFKKSNEGIQGVAAARVSGHFSNLRMSPFDQNCNNQLQSPAQEESTLSHAQFLHLLMRQT